ncbi:MAG: hypothetical protein ABIK86_07485 [candidate division WOR-3 bacterium]
MNREELARELAELMTSRSGVQVALDDWDSSGFHLLGTTSERLCDALANNPTRKMLSAVAEWRRKTGIPVSVHISGPRKVYETERGRTTWTGFYTQKHWSIELQF